ncbi:MAG: hypothetical protein ACI4F9_05645 [Lachnospiraceae bacterium]
MKLSLQRINEAPEKGKALIYFRTRLYYGSFSKKEKEKGIELMAKGENEILLLNGSQEIDTVLELHLFDKEKEYRAVYSQARREYLENIISDKLEEKDSKFQICEECYLLSGYQDEKIGIVNYMQFNEEDMLSLVNYRLYPV